MSALDIVAKLSRICLAAAFTMVMAGPAFAQTGSFSEQDVPASGVASSAAAAVETAPKPPPHARSIVPYTIRPGDTLGSVAAMFGLTPEQLAHTNRISPDEELIAGEELKVPNPYEAQAKSMQSQINSLSAEAQTAEQKVEAIQRDSNAMQQKDQELTEDNQALNSALRVLPWWRATAVSTIVAAALMFGVMIVTLFEWWRMRRRYVILTNLSEDLSRLDYKYKSMLAKAELRLQQLYGRRRGGLTEGQPRPKMPEEVEIERLAEDLKGVLEHHLVKLGARPRAAGKRARWREMMGEVDQQVEAPSVRR